MANSFDSQITDLEKQRKAAEQRLSASPTAMSSGATPTSSDLGADARFRSLNSRIEKIKSDKLKDEWYGSHAREDSPDGTGGRENLIDRTLAALSSPLYGVVGGIEALTGQGTKSGIANIAENMKERETFSDLLKKNKVPYLLAAPVGFALDVAFDPVNWATAGFAATIPRTALGLAKGGVKGAALGFGSNLAGAGATIVGGATLGAKTGLRRKLAGSAADMTRKFNDLTGRDIAATVVKNGPGMGIGSYRVRVGDTIQNLMEKIPGGDKLFRALDYNNRDYYQLLKMKDAVERAGVSVPINTTADEAASLLDELPISPISSLDELDAKIPALEDIAKRDLAFKPILPGLDGSAPTEMKEIITARLDSLADDADFLFKNPNAMRTADPEEQVARLMDEMDASDVDRELMNELLERFKVEGNETGIKWFDDAKNWAKKAKVKDFEVGAKALDGYDGIIRFFKQAKTGLSPSTIMANVLSAPALMMMYGKRFTPGMAKDFTDAYSYLNGGKTAKFIANSGLFDEATGWLEFMAKRPGTFSKTFGMTPKYAGGRKLVEDIMQQGRDMGVSVSTSDTVAMEQLQMALRNVNDDLKSIMAEAADDTGKAMGKEAEKLSTLVGKAKVQRATTPSELSREMNDGLGTASWGGSEFADEENWMSRLSQKVAERSKTEGGWYKVIDAALNQSMTKYEQIDQAWRLTIAKALVKDGITEAELATMSRITAFDERSIVSKSFDDNGVQRFHLAPDKATEIASDILFNYAAMPPAIRMLRAMPVLGAPFASFMYGAALRTGQALAYNPAAFNKIGFALNAAEGEKGPIERQALDSKYYEWYKSPTMLRLPFFEENPIYLNAANMLPYYTLNMFEPSERKYDELLPSTAVGIIDRSPLLKDPVGQILFDYLILPSIVRDAQPINSFGQPLYPATATGVEKAGYATRAAADAMTPNVLAVGGLVAPGETAAYLPGYRTRQIAQAKEGKTSLGILGKEDPASRTLRALAGYAGLPVQRLDTTAARGEVEESLGE